MFKHGELCSVKTTLVVAAHFMKLIPAKSCHLDCHLVQSNMQRVFSLCKSVSTLNNQLENALLKSFSRRKILYLTHLIYMFSLAVNAKLHKNFFLMKHCFARKNEEYCHLVSSNSQKVLKYRIKTCIIKYLLMIKLCF